METSRTMPDLIERLHEEWTGLNRPATAQALECLGSLFGDRPNEEVLALYRNHDGSGGLPQRQGRRLPARLMPIAQALEIQHALDGVFEDQSPGEVLWLWTDDNSNHAGVFVSGLLEGLVTIVDHDEPVVAPRFLSVATFGQAQLAANEEGQYLPTRCCELPVASDEGVDRERLGALAREALARWRGTSPPEDEPDDEGMRRAWASAALCLLPVADTQLAVELLRDPDILQPPRW